jgi:hypothetical protein
VEVGEFRVDKIAEKSIRNELIELVFERVSNNIAGFFGILNLCWTNK